MVSNLVYTLAEVACCPDQVARAIHGGSPTETQVDSARELIQRIRGDVCMAIENSNDLVYKDDVCMTHVRSKPAAQHQCLPGVFECLGVSSFPFLTQFQF